MTYYKFKRMPANLGCVEFNRKVKAKSLMLMPDDIYEYAKAFRSIHTRSMPMLKALVDPNWAEYEEIKQLYGKAQSLAVQIAMSNELLLKAILLGSAGGFGKEHNLKELIGSLDARYQDIIIKHFKDNGLKDGEWDNVLNTSAQTFTDARYGFENKDYSLDFKTLQLLNESLDNLFNNYLPDWPVLTKAQQENRDILKKEVDLVFDEDHKQEKARNSKLLDKALKEYMDLV